jgi:F-type H+-transporting ATPase subunit gamma
LVIASNRGLAGSYNSDILRKTVKFAQENGLENIDFITMGEKAKSFVSKIGGNIVADFPLGEQIRFTFASPAALVAWDGYTSGQYKKFYSIHTHFDSAVRKNATTLQILPLKKPEELSELERKEEAREIDYKFEPSKTEVLNTIIRQTVRALTYQVILESEAAEHASRMVAMKNASDAAGDLKEDFEFTYNQVRQASITSELAEISAGAIAQE